MGNSSQIRQQQMPGTMCFLQVHEESVAAWRRGVQSHANWKSWRNVHWYKVHATKPQTHAMSFSSQTRASKWSLTVFHSWHCYAPCILRLGNLDLDHVNTSKHMGFLGYWVTCACWMLTPIQMDAFWYDSFKNSVLTFRQPFSTSGTPTKFFICMNYTINSW